MQLAEALHGPHHVVLVTARAPPEVISASHSIAAWLKASPPPLPGRAGCRP
jgi:hypothetical protein